MDPNLLFLHRVRQLAVLVQSHEEVDLVDIASKLRQLLFDKRCLVDAVNTDGTELIFRMCKLEGQPDSGWREVNVELNRTEFGQHVVLYSHGQQFTVKDIVKYNANQKGGQHWDPGGKVEYEKLRASESLYINGIVATSRDLKEIGRMVLGALEPLIEAVKARVA